MFSTAMLENIPGGKPFEHCMLVEGNNPPVIDIGLLWRDGFDLHSIRTHLFDEDDRGPIFSRDCCEYHLSTPGGVTLVVLMNHFKSTGVLTPDDRGGAKKRTRQAEPVAEIYKSLVA
ncbi:hypothetical protein PDG61_31735 [Mycolicibacterium sp. BiH015]|uniref:hypothetical protein n=1 Tax=Mycolicibacterium sp. BiH015 TaxID=3018808 RepID=UPI0022E7D449|nr:hypothetical protein [Mycolicibacterium sp. BiH015]MDA2895513.1 hypothetical protein [Mycolicibacterium sp. BiH015]